jgi:hypothetical protein
MMTLRSRGKSATQGGMAALMLVVWTSLGLLSMLFSLADSNGYLLTMLGTERKREAARTSALFCREMLVIRLMENARYVPMMRLTDAPNDGSCTVEFFESRTCAGGECRGASYGEIKKARIKGHSGHDATGAMFEMETMMLVSSSLIEPLHRIYSVQISESL